MILNNTHKFIFVHNPKTGGSSITSALSELTTFRDFEFGRTKMGRVITSYYHRRFGLHKHCRAYKLKEILSPDEWHQYFKFAFIRNPYARIYSTYKFITSVWTDWDKSNKLKNIDSFDDFLRSPFFLTDGPGRIFLPQHTWICDPHDNIIMDYVGTYENLDNDFDEVIDILKKKSDSPHLFDAIELPKLNASASQFEWIDHLTEDNRKIIYNRYQKDFEIFKYSKVPDVIHSVK